MSKISESKILSRLFSDPEAMEAEVRQDLNQDFQILPLDSRPLRLDILRLELEKAIFEFRSLQNPLRIRGAKRTDRLVFEFILSPLRGPYLSHGFALGPDTLYGFDRGRGVDLVLPADLLMGTFMIDREVFEDCLQVMERSDIDDRFLANNYVRSAATFPPVQNYLKELYHLVRRREPFLTRPQISRLLLEDYLPLLIEAIPSKRDSTQMSPRFLNRARLVQQAEEYMLAHLQRPMTLKDLCKILNTSKSPLTYSFQEAFGMSPMAYLKVLRLHAAYRTLKTSDPTTKIADIAHRFGFWHTGRFSESYQQLFGELPSRTLGRSRISQERRSAVGGRQEESSKIL